MIPRFLSAAALALSLLAASPAGAQEPPAPADATEPGAAPVAPPAEAPMSEDDRMASDMYLLASGLYAREMWVPAARKYRELIRAYPRYKKIPEAYYYLAQVSLELKDAASARDCFAQLRAQYPGHPLTHRGNLNEAILLIQANNLKQAIQLLDGLPLDGKDIQYEERVLYYRGVALYSLEQYTEAAANLELLAARPIAAGHDLRLHGRLNLAYLRLKQDDADSARALFQEIAGSDITPVEMRADARFRLADIAYRKGEHQDAADSYAAFITDFPTSEQVPQARISMAWCYYYRQQWQQVLDSFRPNPGERIAQNDQTLFLRSAALVKLNKPEPALPLLRQISSDYAGSPWCPAAELTLVEALYALRLFNESATEAERLLKQNPRHKFALDLMAYAARAYVEQEDWANAARLYAAGLQTYPTRWPDREHSLRALAYAYQQLQQNDKAIAIFKQLYETVSEADKPGVLMRLADIESNAKNLEQARGYYVQVVTEYPKSDLVPLARLNIADLLYRQDKLDESLTQLDAFLKESPNHELAPKALYLRGSVQFHREKLDLAVADLTAALQQAFPEQAFARLILAYAYWQQKKEAEALEQFGLVMDQDAVFQQVRPEFMAVIADRFLERNQVAAAERIYTQLSTHESAESRYDGLLGLGRIATLRHKFDVAETNFREASDVLPNAPAKQAQVQALLGEVYRQDNQAAKALIAFTEALARPAPDARTVALAHYGTAELLAARNDLKNAEDHAASAYLLADDPYYSPRAMLLHMRLAMKMDHRKYALTAWKGLREKYPLAYAAFRDDPANDALFKAMEAEEK